MVWVYGLAVLMGCFATVLVTMVWSGLNDYSVLVVTNNWGEHWIEMCLLVSGMFCFIVGSKKVLKIEVDKKCLKQ